MLAGLVSPDSGWIKVGERVFYDGKREVAVKGRDWHGLAGLRAMAAYDGREKHRFWYAPAPYCSFADQ